MTRALLALVLLVGCAAQPYGTAASPDTDDTTVWRLPKRCLPVWVWLQRPELDGRVIADSLPAILLPGCADVARPLPPPPRRVGRLG